MKMHKMGDTCGVPQVEVTGEDGMRVFSTLQWFKWSYERHLTFMAEHWAEEPVVSFEEYMTNGRSQLVEYMVLEVLEGREVSDVRVQRAIAKLYKGV